MGHCWRARVQLPLPRWTIFHALTGIGRPGSIASPNWSAVSRSIGRRMKIKASTMYRNSPILTLGKEFTDGAPRMDRRVTGIRGMWSQSNGEGLNEARRVALGEGVACCRARLRPSVSHSVFSRKRAVESGVFAPSRSLAPLLGVLPSNGFLLPDFRTPDVAPRRPHVSVNKRITI